MKTRILVAGLLGAALLVGPVARGDDTDIYINNGASALGGKPLVMFTLDLRSNLGSTVCNGTECDSLVAEGFLASVPTSRFNLLRAVLKKVFSDPTMQQVVVGLMVSHDDNCTGGFDAGPTMTDCSNGAYIASGFKDMSVEANRNAFYMILDAIPTPQSQGGAWLRPDDWQPVHLASAALDSGWWGETARDYPALADLPAGSFLVAGGGGGGGSAPSCLTPIQEDIAAANASVTTANTAVALMGAAPACTAGAIATAQTAADQAAAAAVTAAAQEDICLNPPGSNTGQRNAARTAAVDAAETAALTAAAAATTATTAAACAGVAAPPPAGGYNGHPFQGKEMYFELFRYLTGQGIYNGRAGYKDYGDNDPATMDGTTDPNTYGGDTYISPIQEHCSRIFTVNLVFGVANQEHDSNDAIGADRAAGGMPGLTVTNNDNNFNDMLAWLHNADLADGSAEWVGGQDISGKQNVTSYFISDPSAQRNTMNSYAASGGTGAAYLLSDDPEELVSTIRSIFSQILSVSTTMVSASVPVNVFNRAQVLDSLYIALFRADEEAKPRWNGNLKKLKVVDNKETCSPTRDEITGQQYSTQSELPCLTGCVMEDGQYQCVVGTVLNAANNQNGVDAQTGRIKTDAITFWTNASGWDLTADYTNTADPDFETTGTDGRSVHRGGAGQKIPTFLKNNMPAVASSPSLSNPAAAFTADQRRLFTEPETFVNGTATVLRDLNADAATVGADDILTALNLVDTSGDGDPYDEALEVMAFIRGHDVRDEYADTSGSGYETLRRWLLGDPLHSKPLPINYGARGSHTEANPDIRIVMGTNQGLLHMFRDTDAAGNQDGQEVWAFMPKAVMGVQQAIMLNAPTVPKHPYGVDGAAVVWVNDQNGDGTINGTDTVYVYFGLRRGGRAYYALDITDPDLPKLLWSITSDDSGFEELGLTFSSPALIKTPNGGGTEVLIFGGGYHGQTNPDGTKTGKDQVTLDGLGQPIDNITAAAGTDDAIGNAVYVVDARTGALVRKLTHAALVDSVPSELATLDSNGDGLQDRAYVGDTGGNVWRVDLADTDANAWTIVPLLQAGRHATATDRRFFHRPDIVLSQDDQGYFDAVLIGSGDRPHPLETSIQNWFYMIKDRATTSGSPPAAPYSHDQLFDVSNACLLTEVNQNCTLSSADLVNGWRIELNQGPGEKNLASPLTLGGVVFFTTYVPPGTNPGASSTCAPAEGIGYIYAVSIVDAINVLDFGESGEEVLEGGLTVEGRSRQLASGGIPAEVVALPPGRILLPDLDVLNLESRDFWRTYWFQVNEYHGEQY